jgi:hypothetical protein
MSLTFAKRKIIINLTKWLAVIFVSFIILIVDIYYLITKLKGMFNLIISIKLVLFIPTIIIIILEYYILRLFYRKLCKWLDPKMDKYLDNISSAKKGEDGEGITFDELNNILPSEYEIVTNFVIPGKKFDFDFIINGPKGLTIIEVKNHEQSHTIFTYDKAYFKKDTGSLVEIKDSRKILERYADELKNYLKENGIENISIRKAILYVNHESVEIRDGGQNIYKIYIISGIAGLKNYFDKTFLDEKFTANFCNKISTVLSV